MGLIHDIPTYADLLQRIEKVAKVSLKEKLSLLVPQSNL